MVPSGPVSVPIIDLATRLASASVTVPRVELVAARHRDRGRGVEVAGEHPEAIEDHPFVVTEELVRPLDRRPQGLMTLDCGRGACR